MADVFSKEKRSEVMGRIKSKNTKPEIIIRKFLHGRGFRYRLHQKELPGSPDIILKKYHTAIFVNGCFWHGHTACKIYKPPKSNQAYWEHKIENNIRKDEINIAALTKLGWQVIVIWECQLKKGHLATTLESLINALKVGRDEKK